MYKHTKTFYGDVIEIYLFFQENKFNLEDQIY